MHKFRVEAWNPGNGVAFSADVVDYFQAVNVFHCGTRCYRRVIIVNLDTGETLQRYAPD